MTQAMTQQHLQDQVQRQLERQGQDSERLDRNERKNSLAAFLRAIKFRKPARRDGYVERDFAQLHPRARQSADLADDQGCIRSAN